MSSIRIISTVEQVAAHLRGEVLGGRWRETLPGIHPLAAELGVNHKTVKKALLCALQAHGLPKGPYNLPDWEETPEGLHRSRHDRSGESPEPMKTPGSGARLVPVQLVK